MNKHKVFVYGTLRNGAEATHALPDHAMVAYEGKDFKFPYAVPSDGYDIYGNIIEVDDAQLEELDKYENVRSGLYVRKELEVEPLGSFGFDTEMVWVYIAGPSLFNVVEDGDWLSFINKE